MSLTERAQAALQRPDLIWVLASNLIPVIGVTLYGWAALPLLVFYWIENVVIGGFNILKILVSGFTKSRALAIAAVFLSAFFVFHYGLFTFVHGIFVFAMLSWSGEAQAGLDPNAAPDDVLTNVTALVNADSDLYWSVVALVAVQTGWFVFHWLLFGHWRTASPITQMYEPYGRIFVLHMTIMAATLPVIILGEPMLAVLILAVLKSVMELGLSGFNLPGGSDSRNQGS